MKNHTLKIFSSLLLLSILICFSCSKSEDVSPEKKTSKLLVGDGNKTWKVQSVSVNGVSQTALFTGLTIKFSDTSYTTANGGVVWPSPGSWAFTDKDAEAFMRGDGISVEVEVTETSLKLYMVWSKTTYGGRVNSVAGQHIFTFGL